MVSNVGGVMSESFDDDDFDTFNDTVGQITITPDEKYLIRRAVIRDCEGALVWSALIRLAYYSICEKQLKKKKEEEPTFVATDVSIDVKNKKVTIT
jgi:hypothetical protein